MHSFKQILIKTTLNNNAINCFLITDIPNSVSLESNFMISVLVNNKELFNK